MRRRAFLSLVLGLALVTAACGTWTHYAHDAGLSSFNPDETSLTRDNIHQVVERYQVQGATTPPVFSGRFGIAGTGSGLVAFDPNGVEGCSGTPKVCAPLWTAPLGSDFVSWPVIEGGKVFVMARLGPSGGTHLFAFDAAGVEGCTGAPAVCAPLWTSPVLGSRLTATDGRVVAVDANRLAVFDAAGIAGCSGTPKVCAPLWTTLPATNTGFTHVAVAEGHVFNVASSTGGTQTLLRSFDLDGIVGCAGAPTICEPEWTASLGTFGTSAPAVVGDRLFIAAAQSTTTGAAAMFDVHGVENCSGTPKVCLPLWGSAAVPPTTITGFGAVAYGKYLAPAFVAPDVYGTAVYDAAGASCSGSPPSCQPLWYLRASGGLVSVANGMVLGWVGSGLAAFDADGNVGCSGSPKVCDPFWSIVLPSSPLSSRAAPVVSAGKIFVSESQGPLRVFYR